MSDTREELRSTILAEQLNKKELEIESLRQELLDARRNIAELRRICLKRFVTCMGSGTISDDNKYIQRRWHWSCGLCNATSDSDSDQENLVHYEDCPIKWIKEQSE